MKIFYLLIGVFLLLIILLFLFPSDKDESNTIYEFAKRYHQIFENIEAGAKRVELLNDFEVEIDEFKKQSSNAKNQDLFELLDSFMEQYKICREYLENVKKWREEERNKYLDAKYSLDTGLMILKEAGGSIQKEVCSHPTCKKSAKILQRIKEY